VDDQLHRDQPLDGKFHGRVFRNRDNKEEDVFVVFVPRDRHLIEVLHHYYALCESDPNIGIEQLDAIQRLIERVAVWQEENADKIKTPDALPGECK